MTAPLPGPRFLASCVALAALLVAWGAADWYASRRRWSR